MAKKSLLGYLKPKKLSACRYRRSLLNIISFLSFSIPMKSFSEIPRSKFWLRCSSWSFVRLRKACGWISWILFAPISNTERFFKFLKCSAPILVSKFFFIDKYCRCVRLSRASGAISTKIYIEKFPPHNKKVEIYQWNSLKFSNASSSSNISNHRSKSMLSHFSKHRDLQAQFARRVLEVQEVCWMLNWWLFCEHETNKFNEVKQITNNEMNYGNMRDLTFDVINRLKEFRWQRWQLILADVKNPQASQF